MHASTRRHVSLLLELGEKPVLNDVIVDVTDTAAAAGAAALTWGTVIATEWMVLHHHLFTMDFFHQPVLSPPCRRLLLCPSGCLYLHLGVDASAIVRHSVTHVLDSPHVLFSTFLVYCFFLLSKATFSFVVRFIFPCCPAMCASTSCRFYYIFGLG